MSETMTSEEAGFDRARATKILESRRGLMMALDKAGVRRIRCSRHVVQELTETLVEVLTPAEPSFASELSEARAAERRAQLRGLEDAAMAFMMADLLAESPWTAPEKSRRAEVNEAVRVADTFLTQWAGPVFSGHAAAEAKVAEIKKGGGIVDSAEDVLQYATLFRANWHLAEGRSAVTRDYLDAAEADATECLRLQRKLEESENQAADLAKRAFTLWANDYDDLLRLARFLLWDQPEALARVKGIGGRALPGKKAPQPTAAPATPPAPPAPAEPEPVA